MQADIDVMRSSRPGRCPLCNAPLIRNNASQRMLITCPSCGYAAPLISRQTHDVPVAPRRSSLRGSSVWIDPAVSPYFRREQVVEAAVHPAISSDSVDPDNESFRKGESNSGTPVPPRASSQSPRHIKVRPKYGPSPSREEENNLPDIPTLPAPTMWQYETPDFEIESSLPALSLIVDAPTRPETPLPPTPRTTKRLSHIDEIDTVPATDEAVDIDEIETGLSKREQPGKRIVDIDEIDTLPEPQSALSIPAKPISVRSLIESSQAPTLAVTVMPSAPSVATNAADRLMQLERNRLLRTAQQVERVSPNEPVSWTAGGAAGSAYARRVAERARDRHYSHTVSFHVLDHVRWWLLYPGRIESLLWFGGTILLVAVTFVLLLATAISFSWITPNLQFQGSLTSSFQPGSGSTSSPATANGGNAGNANKPTVVTMDGLTITLLSGGPLLAGQPIHLQGRGFTAHGNVLFTNENGRPVLDINSQENVVQADAQGRFTVQLNDTGWTTGQHTITILDMVSGRSATVTVVLASGPFGRKSLPTPTVSLSPSPGVTVTATASTGGGFPTPVNQTPVPVSPTPKISPTAQPSPSATPTQTTPTATPTKAITPTVTVTPAKTPTVGVTPTPTKGTTGSNNGTQLMAASVVNAGSHTVLDAWLWLVIVGYSVALVLLGVAGLVHRRVH